MPEVGRRELHAPVIPLLDHRLALRPELEFAFEPFSGQPCYRLDDPLHDARFRLGAAEYQFISRLDGTRTVRQVVALMAREQGRTAFREAEAEAICRWLVEQHLVTGSQGHADPSMSASKARRPWYERLNPFFLRIPLGNPDRILERLAALNHPWFGGLTHVAWWIVVVFALYAVLGQEVNRFDVPDVVFPLHHGWVLGAIWCLLKLLHELAHGMACKRCGGTVSEAGIALILLTPVAYVDTSSAWRVASKRQRMWITAAGMHADLFAAAVAAIVWSRATDVYPTQIAYGVMTMVGVGSLLFNANPLMRFDGYYLLADWVEVPNLYARGQQIWLDRGKRWIMGVRTASSVPGATRPAGWIDCYGALCLIWRAVVMFSLLLASYSLFQGAGIILTCLGATIWLAVPLAKLTKYVWRGNQTERPRAGRCVAIVGSASFALGLLLLAPWPGTVSAPGTVVAAPTRLVRAEVAGFVQKVHARQGDVVRAGQVLLTLANAELDAECRLLELEVRAAELKLDQLRGEEAWAAVQVQRQYVQATVKRRDEMKQHVQHLELVAPVDGRVASPNVEELLGQYIVAGTELLTVVGDRREIRVSVPHHEFESFVSWIGKPIDVAVAGQRSGILAGYLAEVDPLGVDEVGQPALMASNGGPLAVRRIDPTPAWEARERAGAAPAQEPRWSFTAPRFTARVRIDDGGSKDRCLGQLAHVWFRPVDRSVGRYCADSVRRFILRRLGREA